MSSRSSFKFVVERFGLVRMATLALLAGFGGVFAGVGCGGALGGECLLDSDCNANLICAYQFCHIPCRESRDCHKAGEECLISHEQDKNQYNYCAIPSTCERDVECGESRICAEDQKCREECADDGKCLTGQRCFHGSCRNDDDEPAAGWDAPAGLNEPCGIPSDCASKLCADGVCRACEADYDCGETRICDKTTPGTGGVCTEKNAPLPGKDTLIGSVGEVEDAVLDSEGKYIYFLKYGVYRYGPDGVCKIFESPEFMPNRLAISSDDSTLFVNQPWPHDSFSWRGISSISLPNPPECKPSFPETISWTIRYDYPIPGPIFVDRRSQGDAIFFVMNKELFTGSIKSGAKWVDVPADVTVAVGGGRKFFLSPLRQLGEILPNGSISELKLNLGFDSHDAFNLAPSMAMNRAGDTIYINTFDDGFDSIIAIDVANSFATRRYPLPSAFASLNNPHMWPKTIHRAANKDLFSIVTHVNKLYLFEPL